MLGDRIKTLRTARNLSQVELVPKTERFAKV